MSNMSVQILELIEQHESQTLSDITVEVLGFLKHLKVELPRRTCHTKKRPRNEKTKPSKQRFNASYETETRS